VKVLKKEMLSAEMLREFELESQLLRRIRHSNVVLWIGIATNPTTDALCIVTEYMDGGSLDSWLYSNEAKSAKLTPKTKLRVALHVARGLNHLHCCKPPIMHRDVKPANCLVDEECSVVKIADLGVARVKTGSQRTMTAASQAGTPTYMAPEVHRDEPYNCAADVFSFALLCWELYAVQKPFRGWGMYQLIKGVGDGNERPSPMPVSMPAELAALVGRCWQKQPKDRPEMKEALGLLVKLMQ